MATISCNWFSNCSSGRTCELINNDTTKTIVGLGLGAASHKVYTPLVERSITAFGIKTTNLADPFAAMSYSSKVLATPFVCVLGPIIEEVFFRGDLQNFLRETFESLFLSQGFSYGVANTAARITAVFFSSIIFGLVHFTNALVFMCNPILFLPQVIGATIMGLIFGAAAEISNDLNLPISMHIGNNTWAWFSHYLRV